MSDAPPRCHYCGGNLIRITNRGTLQRSTVTACSHCDAPCRLGCPTCSKMLKTVRIKPD